jgi:hypothetical protein
VANQFALDISKIREDARNSIQRGPVTHAGAERQHAEKAAERISQLGAIPDFGPQALTRSHTDYATADDLLDQLGG